jgi:hypothetical protein
MADRFILDSPSVTTAGHGDDDKAARLEKLRNALNETDVVIDVLHHHQADADGILAIRAQIEDVVGDETISPCGHVIGHRTPRDSGRFI